MTRASATVFLFISLIVLDFRRGEAQEETSSPLKLSAYVEIYYAYDFSNPADHRRPAFLFSHNRHNEFNLNHGYLKAEYSEERVRASFSLMAGTYAQANLAAEPDVLKHIHEAYAGVKVSKSRNVWVDGGIFPSHIGFESATSKDCWTLTRSILAENSPYYETGAKLSYTSADNRWFVGALILNGWQRIQRVEGNNTPAFGTQLTFKPDSNVTLNYSTFIGSDQPDELRRMRYFNNFYGIFQLTSKIGITIGFDIGWEQISKGSNVYNTWWSPVGIVRYTANDKINIAFRAEYYEDENGVIISTGTPNGFQTAGYSINLDYLITDRVLWRIEGRTFNSKDDIFTDKGGEPSDDNFAITTSLAVWF